MASSLHPAAYIRLHSNVRKYLNVFWSKEYWCTIRMSQYMNNTLPAHRVIRPWPSSGWPQRGLLSLAWATVLLVAASGAVFAEGEADAAAQPSVREVVDKARNELADRFSGLQLSAFGDVASSYDDAGRQKLDWGTLELDASAEFSHDLQAAMALTADPAGSAMPVAFVDYHTFGGRIAPRGRLWVEKGFHVQVGRFDVPFGNDWQFFASKDSVSISRPLTTELVMDGGYNDKGIRMLGNNGSVNFNTYVLQGFNAGHLVGGRVGVTPFSNPFSLLTAREPKGFEFGLSYLYDANTSWKKNETAYAVDSEVILDDWSTRFEYLSRRRVSALGADIGALRGWHITQEYLVDEDETSGWPTTVFLRYEQETMEPPEIASLGPDAGDAYDVRVAAGARTSLGGSDIFQLKFELQHYREATPTTRALPGFGRKLLWFTQLVIVL